MSKRGNPLENLVLISQIGISMLIPIFGGVYVGRWIDGKFNTTPIFLFVFIAMGVIVAFINLFKIGSKDTRARRRK